MLVWLRGQNVIFGKLGTKVGLKCDFGKVLASKCDFGKFWGQNVIFGKFGIEM